MEGKNSMKKIMKVLCVFALVFLAGCSSTNSQDEQKQVVTDFFTYVSECDIKNLKEELSQYTEEEYGKVFVEETDKFKKAIFKDLFTDIKIKDVKEDGDKVKVTVTGKEKDYSEIDYDSNELNTTAQNYITEHYDEISKVAQEEGENAALIKVFDEIAPTLYQTMTDTYKKAPTKKLTSTVTLEKKDDKWIITGLDE